MAENLNDDNIIVKSQKDVVISDDADSPSLECPICLESAIHPTLLPCGHIFCFLCVKGSRCAMCRQDIPSKFLQHPQLVNGIEDLCKAKSTKDGYQWFY